MSVFVYVSIAETYEFKQEFHITFDDVRNGGHASPMRCGELVLRAFGSSKPETSLEKYKGGHITMWE
jgi:hypothetical protein